MPGEVAGQMIKTNPGRDFRVGISGRDFQALRHYGQGPENKPRSGFPGISGISAARLGSARLERLWVARILKTCLGRVAWAAKIMLGSRPQMNTTKTTKTTNVTPDVATALLAHLDLLEQQRQNAQRKLLKRRQKKSGQ